MKKVKITINVMIPFNQFTVESRQRFIESVVALFKGFFPGSQEIGGENWISPVTVEIEE